MPGKKYQKSLFVFRRDLRLEDNAGLLAALANSQRVLPIFIFDPRQITTNEYFSAPAFEFMFQSLRELAHTLKAKGARFYVFWGQADKEIARLIKSEKLDAVFVNRDYTPFSAERDFQIAEVCRKKKVVFESFDDALLRFPDAISKNDGGVYTVFTSYFRKAVQCPVLMPRRYAGGHYVGKLNASTKFFDLSKFKRSFKESWVVHGGRAAALAILRSISRFKTYRMVRDFPSLDATTHLSSHLKFGTCSVREVYYAVKTTLGPEHPLLRQLHWRDFFVQVGYHHPYVLGRNFNEKYDHICWADDKNKFASWCEGKTGFPIVDAGMRELNASGFMHNRVRMITASFLVKDLHLDWRWGEKYFAQKLVDYDPLVNNGNWQWAASTGCDAQPYFRIFNPWLQQEKFDKDCMYIKKWIPELRPLLPLQIHRLGRQPSLRPVSYPAMITDHKIASQTAKNLFSEALKCR